MLGKVSKIFTNGWSECKDKYQVPSSNRFCLLNEYILWQKRNPLIWLFKMSCHTRAWMDAHDYE